MALPQELQSALDEAHQSMKKALNFLENELAKLRAGRVSPDLIENIPVNYYGTNIPIKQIASISVKDARTLVVKPWDKNALEPLEKAILAADIGVTPTNDGEQLILAFPPLTEETRKNLVKKAQQIAEQARISIRNARREALETFRKLKKEGIAEDLIKMAENELQKLTDKMITQVDKHLQAKEKDIMTI